MKRRNILHLPSCFPNCFYKSMRRCQVQFLKICYGLYEGEESDIPLIDPRFFDKEVIETEEDKEEGNEGREAQPATKPKTPQKITKNLIARQLTTTWRIEKQEDLDKHIENLKKQIEAQIEDGVIVKVQF